MTINIKGVPNSITVPDDTWLGTDSNEQSIAPFVGGVLPFKNLSITDTTGELDTAFVMVSGNGQIQSNQPPEGLTEISSGGATSYYETTTPMAAPDIAALLRSLVIQPFPLGDPGLGGVYPGPQVRVGLSVTTAQPYEGGIPNTDGLPSAGTAINEVQQKPNPPPPPPPPGPPHPPPVTDNVSVTDLTSNTAYKTLANPYTGTMPGITSEFISPNADSTLIGSSSPGMYLYASGHFNNFYLGQSTGTEMMDGGISSDLMTGGSGTNYYFADDYNTAGTGLVWDTANNFHAGDIAAIWGVTSNFNINWVANTGNPGYLGETVEITAPGKPEVAMDFVGHTLNDLRASFETSGGTPFLRVEAV